MDIERLTKTQIVLLTLLVSFVTSIATGIVTVTLMDQAPPAVIQTLNRVVERTVERVVPDKTQSASVITKETTVVVKDEDLITSSIKKNSKSVVRIREISIEGLEEEKTLGKLVGIGIIVSRDGIIATDPSVLKNMAKYKVETADGDIFNANIIAVDKLNKSEQPMFLLIEMPDSEKKTAFLPATLSSARLFNLGQTVISLTGEDRTDVAIGIIAGLIEEDIVVSEVGSEESIKGESGEEIEKSKTIKGLSVIKTNISEKDVIVGSPLIDIFGEVIGISLSEPSLGRTAMFSPVNNIKVALSNIKTDNSSSVEIVK